MTSLTTQPRYLNARTNIYNAWDLRKDNLEGAGVYSYEDFRVMQTQSGATLGVDIGKTGVGLMKANVRGSTRDGQGLYCIDNIDPATPLSSGFLPQFNVAVTSNASGNPRLDQIVLQVEDSQHAGSNNLASLVCLPGTPSAPVMIDNRTGAAALPANSILLADIIVASGAGTIVTANIRDRRQFYAEGVAPPLGNALDIVTFAPAPGLVQTPVQLAATIYDNMQSAVLMYLPRRIVNATRMRWRYTQAGTAATSQYNMGVIDASGRVIVSLTAAQAFNAATVNTERAEVIAATTFERGWYYVWFGIAPLTAAAAPGFEAIPLTTTSTAQVGSISRSQALRSASGGVTPPVTILGFTDIASLTASTISVPVPMISLSVG